VKILVFSNLIFLFIFLPLNLLLYYFAPNITLKNIVLLLFSLLFYAWGEPVWVFVLILTAFLDYLAARLIEKNIGTPRAKIYLAAVVALNLSSLVLFKYSAFICETVNSVFGLHLSFVSLSLPIGISFYTFQAISYVVDVYRGEVKAQRRFYKILLYLSLYHQLVAGPIVRYQHICDEIDNRVANIKEIFFGLTRFLCGLFKKVVVANYAGTFVKQYMSGDLNAVSVAGAWFGALMFALQIYYDFSAYSDMAIGLGKMFGFNYLENFNYPYISRSVSEFWRRWHISLGSFFRDYVYIPLGGNRKNVYFNLFVVWCLTGLWHGASWNFVLWGLYFGAFIIIEKLFLSKLLEKLPAFISHIYLMFVVIIGWVLFYFTDFKQLLHYLKIMFFQTANPVWDFGLKLSVCNNIFWIALAAAFCLPIVPKVKCFVARRTSGEIMLFGILQTAVNAAIIIICTSFLIGDSYNPFLYFRF